MAVKQQFYLAKPDDHPGWKLIWRFAKQIQAEDGITVTIEERKMTRSLAQNSLLWLWNDRIRIGMVDAGGTYLSKDELHDVLADHLLPTEVIEFEGKTITRRYSTAKLKVAKFTEFLSRIEEWAIGRGISLPHPEDIYHKAMGRKHNQHGQ